MLYFHPGTRNALKNKYKQESPIFVCSAQNKKLHLLRRTKRLHGSKWNVKYDGAQLVWSDLLNELHKSPAIIFHLVMIDSLIKQ